VRLRLFLLLAACCAAPALASDDIRVFKLTSGGRERTYRVYAPPALAAGRKYPLFVLLHGGGSSGKGMRRLTGHCFERRAAAEGAVVAYPDGFDGHWNDYRGDLSRRAQRENVDDAAFLKAMVAEISGKYPVDAARVYAAGMSNGAMMSHALACLASDTFAAVAAVSGAMPEKLAPACAPARPVPVMLVNGTDDPLVHWAGGDVTGPFGRRKLGRVLSAEGTRDFWLKKDGCDVSKAVKSVKDESQKDGTSLERENYAACAGGSEVNFIKVAGGGHTWPGGAQYLPRFLIGRTTDEMAGEEIWDFFMRHPMPRKK
jgi:polyhydroxybutyrate depolymerase